MKKFNILCALINATTTYHTTTYATLYTHQHNHFTTCNISSIHPITCIQTNCPQYRLLGHAAATPANAFCPNSAATVIPIASMPVMNRTAVSAGCKRPDATYFRQVYESQNCSFLKGFEPVAQFFKC